MNGVSAGNTAGWHEEDNWRRFAPPEVLKEALRRVKSNQDKYEGLLKERKLNRSNNIADAMTGEYEIEYWIRSEDARSGKQFEMKKMR